MKACELGDLDKVADGSRESLRGGAGRILADLAGNIGFSHFLRKLCKPMLLGILSGLGCVWELRDIWAKSQPSSFTPFSLRAHWVDAGADGIPRKQGPAGLCRGELRGLCSPPLELLWSVRLPGRQLLWPCLRLSLSGASWADWSPLWVYTEQRAQLASGPALVLP